MQQGNEHIDDLFERLPIITRLIQSPQIGKNSTKNLAVIQVFI